MSTRYLVPLLLPLLALGAGCGGGDSKPEAASSSSSSAPASSSSTTATTASSSSSAALKPCSEVYAEGRVFHTEEELGAICDRGGGDAYLPAASTHTCKDGRTLYWNDEGWGYLGGPFHRHAPGAEKVAPASEREACTG